MATRDMIVIGGSAGSIEALMTMVAGLRADLPAAIAVVVHILPDAESALPAILSRRGPLCAQHAVDGERWQPGRIYVAPPDHHLLLVPGDCLRVTRGPRVNGHRPAIDPLFHSAARQLGSRAIGVVLSGALDDGTAGMMAIARAGGVTIVQAPEDALHPAMPSSVLEHVRVDQTVPVDALAGALARLAGQEIVAIAEETQSVPTTGLELDVNNREATRGPPTMLTCPECGGSLWEYTEAGGLEYRCHVGHAWGTETLARRQDDRLEEAVWIAYRTLEENAALSHTLAERASRRGLHAVAKRYRRRYEEANERAALLRTVLERGALSAAEE